MAHSLLPILAVVFVVAVAFSAFLQLQPWWDSTKNGGGE